MGEDSSEGLEPLHPEMSGMRACDVVRLLNSTPLGVVINERQLFRHRGRAGDCFSNGRRIDFLRYVAWLCEQHPQHKARPKRPRTPGTISPSEVLELVERQGYRCALTGRLLTPMSASLDHIQPIAANGKHSIDNAQVLHRQINRIKGTLTNEEFIAVCREVVAHADSKSLQ